MQMQYTKSLNSGIFELGTTFGLFAYFSRKIWFRNRHFSDADGGQTWYQILTWVMNGLLVD